MLCCDMGAVDFITKPYKDEELHARLTMVHKQNLRLQQLNAKYTEANSVALEAIKGGSELGRVVHFTESLYNINDLSQLAQRVFSVLEMFELNVSLLFHSTSEKLTFSSQGDVKPLERELMNMLSDDSRYHDFNTRTQINFPKVSMLIKNMPINDMAAYGRLKDLLSVIVSAVDSKVSTLDTFFAVQKQARSLTKSFDLVNETMKEITSSIQMHHEDSSQLLHRMLKSLTQSMYTLGLEQDQEDAIINTVDNAIKRAINMQESGDDIMASFEGVLKVLEHILLQQDKLVNDITSRRSISDSESKTEIGHNDIELF